MAKIIACDGSEHSTLKGANAYEKRLASEAKFYEKVPESDREAVKRAIDAGIVRFAVPRKPRKKKES